MLNKILKIHQILFYILYCGGVCTAIYHGVTTIINYGNNRYSYLYGLMEMITWLSGLIIFGFIIFHLIKICNSLDQIINKK